MTSPPWGPRPGGPSISSPDKPRGVSGCMIALMALLLFQGLSCMLSGSSWVFVIGLLMTCGAGRYLFIQLSRPARERRQLMETQRRQIADAELWRQSLPETITASAPDPQSVVYALTERTGAGVFLGLTPDHREWIAADRQQAVLVLGPPRSGKTSGLIIPTLLAVCGPVVSTSTKGEVMQATATARSRLGRIWLFDPSGTEPVPPGVIELHWSPIRSSRTWDGARAMADAMVGASSAGEGVENASYWTESAKTMLAPLLHAAALGGHTITDVRRWISLRNLADAGEVLKAEGAQAAIDNLIAISGTEERAKNSIYMTTRIVLTAYESDAAAARSQHQNFDADTFVRSQDTIYITAPSHLQNMLAPLVVGLLEEIRNATYDLARRQARGEERKPAWPVVWALDELANIAPIKKLPSIVSEAGGQGLQIMACFQDLSQARAKWGTAADGFLSLFGTKVVFPGIGDKQTLDAISTLVGDWDRPYTTFNSSNGESRQFGMGAGFGTNTGIQIGMTAKREALLSPSEVANIPLGHALTLRTGKWGLVEATGYYRSPIWQAVLAKAPHALEDHGEADALPLRYGQNLDSTNQRIVDRKV